MISKQRLTELIEQGATIYDIFKGDIYLVDLTMAKYYDVPKYIEYKNDYYNCNLTRSSEDLFETEEDARWELEMTATRTETLKLPTWEEAQDEKFHFSYLINVKGLHLYISIYNFTKQFEIYCNHGTHTYDYKFDKTFDLRDKEQYKTACKLCLRLFKGEEV